MTDDLAMDLDLDGPEKNVYVVNPQKPVNYNVSFFFSLIILYVQCNNCGLKFSLCMTDCEAEASFSLLLECIFFCMFLVTLYLFPLAPLLTSLGTPRSGGRTAAVLRIRHPAGGTLPSLQPTLQVSQTILP